MKPVENNNTHILMGYYCLRGWGGGGVGGGGGGGGGELGCSRRVNNSVSTSGK